MIPLEFPILLLLIPLGLFVVAKLVRQRSGLGFSSATLLKGVGVGLPLLRIEQLFLAIFVIAGSLILARPIRSVKNSQPVYQQARDIAVVLDISGSMTSDEKLKTAKDVIAGFIISRSQDRIALLSFDIKAFLEWPLSVDHDALVYRLRHISTGGGTRISSGIIAGLKHLRQFGQNPGAIIIVSDGSSEVTPEEKNLIESNLGTTKLYWIWIDGGESDDLSLQFGGYIRSIGGNVFRGRVADLGRMFAEVDQLEASPVIWRQQVTTIYEFGILPQLALLGLLFAGLTNQLREV
jgi:hypothetical protein